MNKKEQAIEDAILKQYESVKIDIREDVALAIKWAVKQLTKHEGSGHMFEVISYGKDQVVCTFCKPEWAGDHCSRPMERGSEAIVMAVCEYLNGA
jgi:hypothetical protein